MLDLRQNVERWVRRIRVRRCEVPFVILFRERSGSTHLCSILDRHPQVVCRREDFASKLDGTKIEDGQSSHQLNGRCLYAFRNQRIKLPTRRQVVGHLHDIYSCPATACGFKWKFPRQVSEYPELMEEFKMMGGDLRVISLIRKNVLKQAISRQNMLRNRATALYRQKNPSVTEMTPKSFEPFEINIDNAVDYARDLERSKADFFSCVDQVAQYTDRPALQLSYESLLHGEGEVLRDVFRFLDVDSQPRPQSQTIKMTPDRLQDIVLNYDQLANAVGGTELESMLDSESQPMT